MDKRSLVGYSPKGLKESDTIEWLSMELRKDISINEWIEIYKDVIPLQYSYLENPMDGGAW